MPKAPECIDFYHAAEHLNAALGDAYGDGSVMARRRFAELRHVLLEEQGGVETVIRAIANLKRKTGSACIARELGYFRNNRARMRYAELKARGFPVGSGVVEAACKTLVAQRMKQSGMRWSQDGGQAILNLRGWSQSGRFDAAWALLAATYKMEVTTVASLVRLRACCILRRPTSLRGSVAPVRDVPVPSTASSCSSTGSFRRETSGTE